MNREITVEYTDRFFQYVLCITWIRSIVFPFLSVILLSLSPIWFFKGFLFYLVVVLFVGLSLILFINKGNSSSTDDVIKLGKVSGKHIIKYNFTDLHLEVSGTFFLWQDIENILKYPGVWMIYFTGMSGYIIFPLKNIDYEIQKFITYQLKINFHNQS